MDKDLSIGAARYWKINFAKQLICKTKNLPKNQEVLKYSHEKQNFYAAHIIFCAKAKELFFLFIFLLKLIDTPGRIHQHIFTGKERM
jgi:hypothetical protein